MKKNQVTCRLPPVTDPQIINKFNNDLAVTKFNLRICGGLFFAGYLTLLCYDRLLAIQPISPDQLLSNSICPAY